MVLRKKTGLRELALFAGAGGGILGGLLLGWKTVAAVEIEDYPRAILLQRQIDGVLPQFPVWDDIRTFDGKPWRGLVDVVSGGFPCQGISAAGQRRGFADERSGLWSEMARIVGEIKPRQVFVENTPRLINTGLDTVLHDLERHGYGGTGGLFSTLHVDCTNVRNRIWILADSSRVGWQWWGSPWETSAILEHKRLGEEPFRERAIESGINGTGYAIPHRVDRLRTIGNGQVPSVAALAWETLNNAD